MEGLHLLVVTLYSKDNTVSVAQKWVTREIEFANNAKNETSIRVMALEKNRGKGGAVKRVSDFLLFATWCRAFSFPEENIFLW